MRKVTTTKKINETIANNLLRITKAEVYYKTSGKTETVDTDKFNEEFSLLCKSGMFADALGWHFEREIKSKGYIVETGRMNPDSEIIVSIYLDVCEGTKAEDVEKTLLFWEEE